MTPANPNPPSSQDESNNEVLLGAYQAKRNFDQTPEPQGATTVAAAVGQRFVVQRHRGSRLHYDFRLEVDGVLVSWAVPKGPSMDPTVKRLAVHVEDHPLDYFDFEGVIPARNYGAGDVIVWDWGTWHPGYREVPADAIRAGELHVDLHGEKLSGRFVLVRSNRHRQKPGSDQWLMFRKRDAGAIEGWDPEQFPRSVKTGRTNEDVKKAGSLSSGS